jgi:glycosyltransferase involved in cell wall biosynthesis
MNEKPRVLFITTSFPTDLNQASGIFVFRLIDRLTEWIDPFVLTPDTTPDNNFKAGLIHLIPARYAPRKHQTLAHSPGGIPETIKRHPLNYISLAILLVSLFLSTLKHGRHSHLIHSNWSISGLVGGAAAFLIGRPAIVTLRGADLNRAKSRRLDRTILRIAIRLNDRIVCVSRSQREWLLNNFPEARSKTLHIANGVFIPVLPGTGPETHRTGGKSKFKLVSVGSLIKRKGHAIIIQTLASLPEDSGVTLTIIGEGPDREMLENLITSLGLSSSITLLGHVAPDRIPGILAQHDAFVLCSYSEGRSNALLEAMATAMPIIATDIPGTNELINNNRNGILIPCDDNEALRNAIFRIRDNPDLRENIGQSALQTISDLELTWDQAAKNYLDLYMQLIKNDAQS